MMNRQDRAKQFAPFDALNGLREALAKKEYDLGKVERGEHSEELDSEISDKLSKVQRGDRIALTCYFCAGNPNRTIAVEKINADVSLGKGG